MVHISFTFYCFSLEFGRRIIILPQSKAFLCHFFYYYILLRDYIPQYQFKSVIFFLFKHWSRKYQHTFIDNRHCEGDADDAHQVRSGNQRAQDGPDTQRLTFARIDKLQETQTFCHFISARSVVPR